MNDEYKIALYHQLTEKALAKVFGRFKENPKLILTESDLKCWLFLELVKEIEGMQESTLSVHTEVTHYLQTEERKNRRFRDLTILDSENLNLNEDIWKNNDNGDYTLNKGFKHSGPAMHFELKLLRQGLSESSQGKLDVSMKRKIFITWWLYQKMICIDDCSIFTYRNPDTADRA